MGATQRGTLQLVLEPTANTGRQLLLPATTIAATMSLTTQPNGISTNTQMNLHIIITGATASGTVTIAGLKNDAVTVATETTPTIAAATAQQPTTEYCTTAIYNTVNASGITTTGLTSGTITIYGVYSGTKLIPANFEVKDQFDWFNPDDHRGIMYHDVRLTQENKHVQLDKFEAGLYPETCTWIGYAGMNSNVTTSTIPTVPTVKLASTAVASSPFTLTTQPVAPGEILQFVVTATSTYGTISTTGTNNLGQTITEVITCPGGAGTFYTQNAFATVAAAGVVTSGLTGGSCAINGIFGTKFVFKLPGTAALQSAALNVFTGTDSSAFPFGFLESWEFQQDVLKEVKLVCKWWAQDKIPLGNRSTTLLATNRLPTLGQPFDYPIVGWNAKVFIDAMGGTAGTTQYNDLLSATIKVATGQKPVFTTLAQQVYSRVYQDGKAILASFDAVIDLTDMNQYELFRQNVKQQIRFSLQGPFIGNSPAGTLNYKLWQIDMPTRFTIFDIDRSVEKVQAKITGNAEYDPTLGYAVQLTIINQSNPNFANSY